MPEEAFGRRVVKRRTLRVLAVVAVLLLAPLLLAAYAVLTAIRVVAELLDDDHAQDWR